MPEAVIPEADLNRAADANASLINRVSLHTGDPGVDGTANELTVGTAPGYARQVIAFDPAAAGIAVNDAAIEFLADGGNWPEVTHMVFWTDPATFHGSQALNTARQINDGNTIRFAAGQLRYRARAVEFDVP